MNERELQQQVHEGYQAISNKWMKIQLKLLFCCMVVSGILEIFMFFMILKAGALNCSVGEYWLKYVIAPFALNLFIVCIGYGVLKRKKISAVAKQYIVSLLFVALALVLELMHSGFVAVLVVAIFPILMTAMYENQRLSLIIAVSTAISQAISGFCIFWDADKLVNSSYKINLIILLTATFCTWLACAFMIDFMKMKRKIFISNDMERFRLQRDINIDGLTGAGNKLALLARLDSKDANFKGVEYLAMLDLDHFKEINDTYGHIFGDDVLRCIGDALRNMRGGAEAYRYGGDEFCVVFPEKQLEDVLEEIKKAQAYLTEHINIPDGRMNIFVSVGVAAYSSEETINELLRRADDAMYKAKTNPQDKIIVYDNMQNNRFG